MRDRKARGESIAPREAGALLFLCLAAALRVFLLSAAFPLFNNVDEIMHADVVLKYARGEVPRGLRPYGRDSAEQIILYGSPEYYYRRELVGVPLPPPVWSYPPKSRARFFESLVGLWENRLNPESTQQPAYYAIAALWYRLGGLLGASGGDALYWIRFMNIAVVMILIGMSYFFLRRRYPESLYLRLGVPALLAFLPQTTFLSINSDVLSPVFFTAAFYGLLAAAQAEEPGVLFCVGVGAAAALAVLTKITNVSILGVLAAVLLLRRRAPGPWAALCAAALAPVALWAARDWLVLGDPTGSAAKIRFMGWTLKPLGELWRHPLFTPRGLLHFLNVLARSYWRGEFIWHGEGLAQRAAACDLFYPVSSAVFLAASAAGLRRGRDPRRTANALSFLALGLSALFLAAVSLAYDFGDCPYPSRADPFFMSGRLIGGTLVPFLVLYLDGLERLLSRVKAAPARWAALAAIAVMMLGSQVWLTRDVFSSAYNWYHLP